MNLSEGPGLTAIQCSTESAMSDLPAAVTARAYTDVVPPLDFLHHRHDHNERVVECRDTVRMVTGIGARALGRAHVVGIGGSTRSESSTERVLAAVLQRVEERGATTTLLAGADIELPIYAPERLGRSPAAQRLVAEVERADGIVIASPGYHGGISGMVKNALDYLEDLRAAPRPYLDGRAVGLIACADGPQATTTTLMALRAVVHALRGWPTPLGIAMQTKERGVALDGTVESPELAARIDAMADQVLSLVPVAAR